MKIVEDFKKLKKLCNEFDAFLASDSLIKQIRRVVGMTSPTLLRVIFHPPILSRRPPHEPCWEVPHFTVWR